MKGLRPLGIGSGDVPMGAVMGRGPGTGGVLLTGTGREPEGTPVEASGQEREGTALQAALWHP